MGKIPQGARAIFPIGKNLPAPLPRATLVVMEPTANDRFAAFTSCVNHWAFRLGLTDWYVDIKHDLEGTDAEAQVEHDRDTRYAVFTYYSAATPTYPIEKLALHEVLHLLFADMWPEGCGDDVAREEHRVIERLLHVLL
jgi:hypothetical protein